MSKLRLLIRADDLGYSEGVNYGIANSVKDGIIRSVGLMTNMDYYNNERYQWRMAKLSPNEYYEYISTGAYPDTIIHEMIGSKQNVLGMGSTLNGLGITNSSDWPLTLKIRGTFRFLPTKYSA